MDIDTNVVVAGIFGIIASVASAVIARYGIAFWRPAKKIRLTGKPIMMRLIDHQSGIISAYSKAPPEQSYEHAMLTLRGTRATLRAGYVMNASEHLIKRGLIRAKGVYHDNHAVMTYEIFEPGRKQRVMGTLILHVPSQGTLIGYYMVESSLHRGKISLGQIVLERVI